MAGLMTLVPQVMAAVGNRTAFNTCDIHLLIIKMTFQEKVEEIALFYYKYQLVCLCECASVFPVACAVSGYTPLVVSRMP